jgi:hypothetical protein
MFVVGGIALVSAVADLTWRRTAPMPMLVITYRAPLFAVAARSIIRYIMTDNLVKLYRIVSEFEPFVFSGSPE